MKIETINDKNFYNHDFKATWSDELSYDKWLNFLKHNYNYSRKETYDYIKNFIKSKFRQSFLEIGFGNCYDFGHCFKEFHNDNKIIYTGWEITEQFVEYARRKYPNFFNRFHIGSFKDLQSNDNISKYKEYDIIYTRHTLEHQHPHNCYKYFENILKSTKKLAIITWFRPPKNDEKFTWNNRDGNGKGAYVNFYSKNKLIKIINKNDFHLDIIEVNYNKFYNEIYILNRS